MDENTSVKSPKPSLGAAIGFVREKKRLVIAVCGILLTAILLLIFLNPANSPSAVFGSYLDCLRSQNEPKFLSISYGANFSKSTPPETIVESYRQRFSSADSSYKNGGRVDLLNGARIKVTGMKTPEKSEMSSIRSSLGDTFENTARITDVRDISFDVIRGTSTSKGSARAICVTGKWYIHEVSGI